MLIPLTRAKDASEENLRTAMLGCGTLVVALVVLAPLLAVPVIRLTGRLTRRFGVTGHLARQNALRDPRRTAATAATLLVSTALVTGLAVIGNSTGQALDRQAAAGLGADYVVSTGSTTTGIDPAAVRRVAGTSGVRTASAVTDSTVVIGGRVRDISGVAPDALDDVMKLDFVSGSAKELGPGRIALSGTVARENGVGTGGRIEARMGRSQDFATYTVVGVYRDNPIARDVLGARGEVQQHAFLPDSVQRVLVRTDAGAASRGTEDRLRTAVGNNPLLKVQDRPALVREAAGTMGDLLTLMYGLLAIGAVIAALGLANTLAMSVAERTREVGVLRAVGMDRAGVRRMIRLEAVTVAAFGTALGLAGGLFGAWAVGALANGAVEQYALALPWGTLLLVCVVSSGSARSPPPSRPAARRP
ncbi:ABC transporter permease [Kitasatospora aburaviensis]